MLGVACVPTPENPDMYKIHWYGNEKANGSHNSLTVPIKPMWVHPAGPGKKKKKERKTKAKQKAECLLHVIGTNYLFLQARDTHQSGGTRSDAVTYYRKSRSAGEKRH